MLSAHDQRRISVTAFCDQRSVSKYLHGQPLRPMLRLRIELALKELGLEDLLRIAPEKVGAAR